MENSIDELFQASTREDGDTAIGPTSSNELLFQYDVEDPHAVEPEPASSTADVTAAKEKRRIANRESARRMRQRKVEMLNNLSQEVTRLSSRNAMLEAKTKTMARQFSKAKMENQLLRARVQELCVEADAALQHGLMQDQLSSLCTTAPFPFPPPPPSQQPLCSPTATLPTPGCAPPLTPAATACPPAIGPAAAAARALPPPVAPLPALPPPALQPLPLNPYAQLQSACHAAALNQAALNQATAAAMAYSAYLNPPAPALQPSHSCTMANFLDAPPWPSVPEPPSCTLPLTDASGALLNDRSNPWGW